MFKLVVGDFNLSNGFKFEYVKNKNKFFMYGIIYGIFFIVFLFIIFVIILVRLFIVNFKNI